jgi:hypothetical protein
MLKGAAAQSRRQSLLQADVKVVGMRRSSNSWIIHGERRSSAHSMGPGAAA